jgi:hypothetical protein
MPQPRKSAQPPGKDKPLGDSKAGGETPRQRFAERSFPPGYEQKGDIERPPFEGHPAQEENKAREPNTAGQHGQRPKRDPHST